MFSCILLFLLLLFLIWCKCRLARVSCKKTNNKKDVKHTFLEMVTDILLAATFYRPSYDTALIYLDCPDIRGLMIRKKQTKQAVEEAPGSAFFFLNWLLLPVEKPSTSQQTDPYFYSTVKSPLIVLFFYII